MLKATLREHFGSVERDKRTILLDHSLGTITLGRSAECTYQIGKTLGDWAKGIGRTQATIEFGGDDSITLIDGKRDQPSTNGIWMHAEQVNHDIALAAGMELTLFKSGLAKVSLIVSGVDDQADPSKDTYTGQDLLGVLQEQVSLLQEQTQRMQEQVVLLAEQLTQREKIDEHQEQTIAQMSKTTKRILSSILGLTAAVVLGSGYAKDLSASDRQQWMSLILSIALGGSAVYVQKAKEADAAKP